MLNSFKVITDELNNDAVLYSWKIGSKVFYGVDVYKPWIADDMIDEDKLCSYESAMGYSLRKRDPEDIYFIEPIPINNGDIKRLLSNNISKLSGQTLFLGFRYDACPPNDGSNKNLKEVITFAVDNGINVIISTAYTINTDLRTTLSRCCGKAAIDIRIPHTQGINNPSFYQICYNARRLDHYGGNTRVYLSFIPIPTGNDTLSISQFFAEISNPEGRFPRYGQFPTSNIMGMRLWVPEEPLVPEEYLALLPEKIIKTYKQFPENIVIRNIVDAWQTGRTIEVFGQAIGNKTEFSAPMVRYDRGFKYNQPEVSQRESNFVANNDPYGRGELVRRSGDEGGGPVRTWQVATTTMTLDPGIIDSFSAQYTIDESDSDDYPDEGDEE